MQRKRQCWRSGWGGVPVVIVVLLLVVGCVGAEEEVETNPRCFDGPPRGAGVEHLDDGRILEDDRLRLLDSDTVFVGRAVEADLLPEDHYCLNGMLVHRRMTVEVDEVLFGEPIEGEIVVLVEDSTMALSIELGRPESRSGAIFFVRKTGTPGVWLARGPEHLDYETQHVDRWREKIAELEEDLARGYHREYPLGTVPSGTTGWD